MGRLQNRPSPAKISMYLGSSKYWWAYLGIKSNPSIVPLLDEVLTAQFSSTTYPYSPQATMVQACITLNFLYLMGWVKRWRIN